MGKPTADLCITPGRADARLALQPIDAAVSRTNLAARERGDRLLGAPTNFRQAESQIRGNEATHEPRSLKARSASRKLRRSCGAFRASVAASETRPPQRVALAS